MFKLYKKIKSNRNTVKFNIHALGESDFSTLFKPCKAKQSKAKQSKAKQSKAKQSKAKQSKAKQKYHIKNALFFILHFANQT